MRFYKKFLAMLLAVLTAFSVCQPICAASPLGEEPQPNQTAVALWEEPNLTSAEEYEAFLQSADTQLYRHPFYGFLRVVRVLIRLAFGQLLLPDRNFDVRIDPFLEQCCAYIADNSGLDIVHILHNLPETSRPAELIVNTFGIDTGEMRAALYEKRDAYYAQGKAVPAFLCYFLGVYFSVLDGCDVLAEPTGAENEYAVKVLIRYRNGDTESFYPGIYINGETGDVYKPNGKGIIDTGFNCSIYDLLVYATVDAWMRDFGYCFWYDLGCYLLPNWVYHFTTRRFKFDYGDKEWMIQIWKGNYAFSNGGEIGVYNRDRKKSGSYYDCVGDDDMLVISMSISHGDEELFSLPPKLHWWRNGFKLCKESYPPSSLTMRASIVMRDEAMRDAFCRAIDRNIRHDVRYTTDGLTVYIEW